MNKQEPNLISAIRATALRLHEKAPAYDTIKLPIEKHALRPVRPDEVVVEIEAAAVNPSDAKAAIGLMPYAMFPRTPGRDFAGKVIVGPQAFVGKRVFGSSGDLGIRQDGSHASHMIVEAEAVVEIPAGVDVEAAAGIGVPFVTAWEGLRRAGLPEPGETVLILGVNGKVGQAATQIATWRGARVIGVTRRKEPYEGHANGPVDVIAVEDTDVPSRVRELTGGKGADVVYNTVGDPFYDIGQKSMAVGGRAIFISAIDRFVTFDLLAFYKGRHTYVGVDTISLNSIATGAILKQLAPGFAAGKLKPYPIAKEAIYRFDQAHHAYQAVMASSRDRIVLVPGE
jgi:NADPH2:quinone reductase